MNAHEDQFLLRYADCWDFRRVQHEEAAAAARIIHANHAPTLFAADSNTVGLTFDYLGRVDLLER